MIIRGDNSKNIMSEDITVTGYNSGNIEGKGVTIGQHNSGNIEGKEITIGEHNSGNIESKTATINEHNSGNIKGRKVIIKSHNSGKVKAGECRLYERNTGEILAKTIHYQGLEINKDLLESLAEGQKVNHDNLALKKEATHWIIEDKHHRDIVQKLSVARDRVRMRCKNGSGGGTIINVGGNTIKFSSQDSVIISGGNIRIVR